MYVRTCDIYIVETITEDGNSSPGVKLLFEACDSEYVDIEGIKTVSCVVADMYAHCNG